MMCRSVLRVVALSIAVGLIVGCGGCSSPDDAGTKPSEATTYNLKSIWLACSNFQGVNAGRAATKAEDLNPFLKPGVVFPESARKRDEECFQAWEQGNYGVLWTRVNPEIPKGTDLVVAYETRTKEKGGFVIFADFRIEWMNSIELEKAIQRAQQ